MKQFKITFLLSMLMSMVGLQANAFDIDINGIYYYLDEDSKTATVCGGYYTGAVVIPSKVTYKEEYNVTSIGNSAFYGCTGLTSISIGNNVTSIGSSAFYNCPNLTSIIVESGNTKYDSRDNCNAVIETGSNTLIVGCSNTVIPIGVTSIGSYAFYGCKNLTSIDIPDGVTSIESNAFADCSGLTSVSIGCDVTSIGSYAFSGCSDLTSVTIPEKVTSIGERAFSGCSDLTSVTIPEKVTSIGEQVFSGCSGLTSVEVNPGNTKYDSRNNCNAIIETGSNTLIVGCNNTVIPIGVTSIGSNAFSGCKNLTSIDIPDGVTSIGSFAFENCKSITSIVIPEGVTNIQGYTFSGCSNLSSVTIPSTVTSIGSGAFWNCTHLTSIVIPDGVTSIGDGAFYGCKNLTSIVIPEGVTSIQWDTFSGCSNLSSVTIPSTVTSIEGSQAFYKCNNLTTVKVWIANPINISHDTFENRAHITLYVPYNSLDAYKKANYWQEFWEILPLDKPVEKIELDKSVLNIQRLGTTRQLEAVVTPDDAANKAVTWTSGNNSVCTVSGTGLVTAVGAGTTTVTVTTVDGGKTATCTVIVTPLNYATIKMDANGIQTFCCDEDIDFTGINGLKAFIASGFSPSTGEVTMTSVNKVPAGEGLIVKGEAGSYDVPFAETDCYYANLLVGVPTATTVSPTDGSYTNFILANDELKGIGFYPLASAGEIGPNKAYLQLPTSILPAASRSLRMVFEDEEDVTGINALNEKGALSNEKFFDLQGRRVMKPTRGLYIKDGKKIMVK